MSAYNRLHFFKEFDPQADYIAIKVFTTGGKSFSAGDAYDLSLMPMHKNKAMFNSRKITFVEAANNPAVIAAVVEENVINLVPKIVKGKAGYMHIEVDGEKIGKSSRNEADLADVVRDYLEG